MKTYNFGDLLPELPDIYRWDVTGGGIQRPTEDSWGTLNMHNGKHWENVAWIINEQSPTGPYEVFFAPVGVNFGHADSSRVLVDTLTDAINLITARALLGMV